MWCPFDSFCLIIPLSSHLNIPLSSHSHTFTMHLLVDGHIKTYIRANSVCLQGHLIKSSEAVLGVLFLSRLRGLGMFKATLHSHSEDNVQIVSID